MTKRSCLAIFVILFVFVINGAAQTVGAAPIFITTADLNNDGFQDLAVANTALGTGSLSILLGNGDGSFQPQKFVAAGNYPRSIAVADFNRDGKLDLAVANEGPSTGGTISILIGKGDGTFLSPSFLISGLNPASVVAGDFNGDGFIDIAVANSQQFQTTLQPGSVSVFLGKGDGTFGPASFFGAGFFPIAIAAADLNGDGKLDLATANFGGVTLAVLLGNGDGSFQPALFVPAGREPFSIAVADLDGDGHADLISANHSQTSTGGTVSTALGIGDGTFQTTAYLRAGLGVVFVAVGDFNLDGKADLAVANTGGSAVGGVTILLGNGDGTFQAPAKLSAGLHPESIAVGDYNRDGHPDLAVVNSGKFPNPGTVSILLGDGKGGFQLK
ncbi:MAG: VCBS repeat-containing protein [Bryobacteraceae bacterium]